MSAIMIIVALACLTGGAIALWVVGSLRFTSGVERPKYSVLDKKSGYEIREYEPYIVAKTELSGSFSRSLNRGFGIIANYIFGNNVRARSTVTQEASSTDGLEIRSEKIPMTAPVLSEKGRDREMQDKYAISFVMPSKYTMTTLPVPRDSRVELLPIKRHVVAAVKFSGYSTERRVLRISQQLRENLARDKIKARSGYKVAQYDPPFAFPLMRRNEVLIDLEDDVTPEIRRS